MGLVSEEEEEEKKEEEEEEEDRPKHSLSSPLSLHHTTTQPEGRCHKPGREPSAGIKSEVISVLDFPFSTTVSNKIFSFRLLNLWYFVIAV
jgi:hypothetical protein